MCAGGMGRVSKAIFNDRSGVEESVMSPRADQQESLSGERYGLEVDLPFIRATSIYLMRSGLQGKFFQDGSGRQSNRMFHLGGLHFLFTHTFQ